MRFFGHTFVAVAVVASLMLPTRAALMTDAEETAKIADLKLVSSLFNEYYTSKTLPWLTTRGKECKAVSAAYLPYKSGGTSACDSSEQCLDSSTETTACCKKEEGGPQKADGCKEAPEKWRKANNGNGKEDDGEVSLQPASVACSAHCVPGRQSHRH